MTTIRFVSTNSRSDACIVCSMFCSAESNFFCRQLQYKRQGARIKIMYLKYERATQISAGHLSIFAR